MNSESEETIEQYTTFLNMLNNFDIEKVKGYTIKYGFIVNSNPDDFSININELIKEIKGQDVIYIAHSIGKSKSLPENIVKELETYEIYPVISDPQADLSEEQKG